MVLGGQLMTVCLSFSPIAVLFVVFLAGDFSRETFLFIGEVELV